MTLRDGDRGICLRLSSVASVAA